MGKASGSWGILNMKKHSNKGPGERNSRVNVCREWICSMLLAGPKAGGRFQCKVRLRVRPGQADGRP